MSKKGFPGKGLSNTQTCSSKGSYPPPPDQTTGERVGRPERAATSHPQGAQFPGKGLAKTQTANHPPIKR